MEPAPSVTPSEDERLWAMLAHVLTLISAFVAPLVIYLVFQNRSKFVAFHALQSLFFHLAVWVVGLVLLVLIVTVVLACVAIPLASLVGIGALVYMLVAAIKAHQGERFEYAIVGPLARGIVGL